MKTMKKASEDSGIHYGLICAVLEQLGENLDENEEEAESTLSDIANHGADAGWSGFTTYHDTWNFYKSHRADINGMVKRMAADLGEEPLDMVAGFNCLKIEKTDSIGRDAVGRCIYGGRLAGKNENGEKADAELLVCNALAWFALEEVARAFED